MMFTSFSQKVEEVVEKYNQAIDPDGKLDYFTHLQVDLHRSLFNSRRADFQTDTLSYFFSVFGENSFKNWSDDKKVDVTKMVDITEWERKNVLKIHINYLICDNDESFELVETTDSTYLVNKFSPDREIHYEIDRENYDLIRKTIRFNSNEMTSHLFDYIRVNNIKVATRLSFGSEIGTAEQFMFNYSFRKVLDGVVD